MRSALRFSYHAQFAVRSGRPEVVAIMIMAEFLGTGECRRLLRSLIWYPTADLCIFSYPCASARPAPFLAVFLASENLLTVVAFRDSAVAFTSSSA